MFDALTRRSPRRRWSSVVLIGSFGVHAAAALAVMVWSMWKIELLVPERMPVSIVWAGTDQPQVPEEAPEAKPEPTRTKPPHRPVADAQPSKQPPVEAPPDDTGGGTTTEAPTTSGEPTIGTPCEGPCDGAVTTLAPPPPAVCGDGQVAGAERCDDGNTADGDGCSRRCQLEPPRRREVQTVESLRVSGEARILPPASVQSQMQRGGSARVDALFRVCLDAAGKVTEVTQRKSTGFAEYDARLASGVRGWRYRPHSVDGVAVPVCGSVRFVYVQR